MHFPVDCKWEPMSKWSACSATCGSGTMRRKLKGTPPKHGGIPCTDGISQRVFDLVPSNGNTGPNYVRLEEEACNIKECAGE